MHISNSGWAAPADPEVALPATATPQKCPAVQDRSGSTNSACKSNRHCGHVRFLQAIGGTECAVSSKSAATPSCSPSCQCGLCGSRSWLCRKFRFRVRTGCLQRPKGRGQNIHRPDHTGDVCPTAPPPQSLPGSPAKSRFAYGCFRSSSAKATPPEKGPARKSCGQTRRDES